MLTHLWLTFVTTRLWNSSNTTYPHLHKEILEVSSAREVVKESLKVSKTDCKLREEVACRINIAWLAWTMARFLSRSTHINTDKINKLGCPEHHRFLHSLSSRYKVSEKIKYLTTSLTLEEPTTSQEVHQKLPFPETVPTLFRVATRWWLSNSSSKITSLCRSWWSQDRWISPKTTWWTGQTRFSSSQNVKRSV